mgnify:FL=1
MALCFSTSSVSASGLKLKGEMTQGSLIRGQVEADHQVWLNDTPIKISPDGYFVFGFGRDAKLSQQLKWIDAQGVQHIQPLTLQTRTYNIQKIDGIPSKYVSPLKEVSERI